MEQIQRDEKRKALICWLDIVLEDEEITSVHCLFWKKKKRSDEAQHSSQLALQRKRSPDHQASENVKRSADSVQTDPQFLFSPVLRPVGSEQLTRHNKVFVPF